MTILVGGGTGFVGSALVQLLVKSSYPVQIVTRTPLRNANVPHISWTNLLEKGLPQPCEAVINLAGLRFLEPTKPYADWGGGQSLKIVLILLDSQDIQGSKATAKCGDALVANQLRGICGTWWTPKFKQEVYDSRIHTTKQLAKLIVEAKQKPDVFITISAVGFYTPSVITEYTEHSAGGDSLDFWSRLCADWETAARLPENCGVRHVTIRNGVVLGRSGGMIANLFWPFYFGSGGPMGSGRQWISWIHLDDLTRLFLHVLETDNVEGVLNGTAPHPCTNSEFAKAFGSALWRPAILPMPEFVVNGIFGPERGRVLLTGQKVLPKRTLESGFQFKYANITDACKEVARLSYTSEEKARRQQ